jgi:microcystin-dependent protein
MANPFVGEIRLFAGNFPPLGWAFCDGSIVSITENETLFQLIGTTYGGDGQNTFALPDLRGRVPVHQGQGPGLTPRVIGQLGGADNVTLTPSQLPAHNHVLHATVTAASSGNGVAGSLTGTVATGTQLYGSTPGGGAMAASALTPSGGNQPHNNLAPFLSVNFIIALFGIFPSQG